MGLYEPYALIGWTLALLTLRVQLQHNVLRKWFRLRRETCERVSLVLMHVGGAVLQYVWPQADIEIGMRIVAVLWFVQWRNLYSSRQFVIQCAVYEACVAGALYLWPFMAVRTGLLSAIHVAESCAVLYTFRSGFLCTIRTQNGGPNGGSRRKQR